MDNKLKFTVPPKSGGITALTFLKKQCNISSRMIACLKREKDGILRNGKLLKTIDILHSGDIVELNLPVEKNKITPIKGVLDILFEDDSLLIVNKPAGIPVHPTKVYQTNTLANIVVFYSQSRGESFTFRAVNRLDKDTSGIVVIAKNSYVASRLSDCLEKTYYALCQGYIYESGTVNFPIKIKEGHTVQRCTSLDGKPSVTHYTPLQRGNNHTLLEIHLETGRTHQIRCHMSSISHPLAGDDMYGGSLNYISRQALHCGEVAFIHPIRGEKIQIKCDLPCEFYNIISKEP